MKCKLLSIFILFSVFFSNAQTTFSNKTTFLDNNCPPPKESDYKALCTDIGSRAKVTEKEFEYYEYTWEKRLFSFACVNVQIDNEETIKRKLQSFWNKYKTNCKCDSLTFGVQNGNILKFAFSQDMPSVIETLADYGLDINFIDPVDGLNLLDYVNAEISRMSQLQNSENSVMVYNRYRANIIGIGGKSSKQ
jgi:hypothetical protein